MDIGIQSNMNNIGMHYECCFNGAALQCSALFLPVQGAVAYLGYIQYQTFNREKNDVRTSLAGLLSFQSLVDFA